MFTITKQTIFRFQLSNIHKSILGGFHYDETNKKAILILTKIMFFGGKTNKEQKSLFLKNVAAQDLYTSN